MIWALILIFVVCLVLRYPIAFALGISCLVYLLLKGTPLVIVPAKLYSGIDVFVLLSIPGFILAGNLMNHGGLTEKNHHLLQSFNGAYPWRALLGQYRSLDAFCRNIGYRYFRYGKYGFHNDSGHEKRRV